MEEFIPGQIYTNLVKLMTYRNVVISSNPIDAETVVQKLNHYEFVTIAGKRSKDDPRGEATVIIILIAPNSKFSSKSGDFKKLLKGFPKMKFGDNLEILVVSEFALTIHIKKYILKYKTQNPKIHIEDYDYSIFMIEAPKHESVPLHTIATDEEVEEFCAQYYTTRDKFPKILQSDTQAVWLGLRPGIVVRIVRVSETAGIAIAYRICIKG